MDTHNPDTSLLETNPSAQLIKFQGGGLSVAALQDRLEAAEGQAAALAEEMGGELYSDFEQHGGAQIINGIDDIFLKNFGLIKGKALNTDQATKFIAAFKDVNLTTEETAAATDPSAAVVKVTQTVGNQNNDLLLIFKGLEKKSTKFTDFLFIFNEGDLYTQAINAYFSIPETISTLDNWNKYSKDSTKSVEMINKSILSVEDKEKFTKIVKGSSYTPAPGATVVTPAGTEAAAPAPAPGPGSSSVNPAGSPALAPGDAVPENTGASGTPSGNAAAPVTPVGTGTPSGNAATSVTPAAPGTPSGTPSGNAEQEQSDSKEESAVAATGAVSNGGGSRRRTLGRRSHK